jgi:hypothetical protein
VLASILVAVAAAALLWMVGSTVLRALAWFLVAAMAISLIAGIPVPTGVVVGTVVCWAGGHVIYRLRHGYWRSYLLENALSRRRLQP